MQVSPAPLSIGTLGIDPQLMIEAKDHILSLVAPVYKKLFDEAQQNLAKNPAHYDDLVDRSPRAKLKNGLILISPEALASTKPGEARYNATLFYTIKTVTPNNPLDRLIIRLFSRLVELNYPCNTVEVRLEKGCFAPETGFWHIDGKSSSPYAITTCFSNVANWSTRLAEDNRSLDEKLYDFTKYPKGGPEIESRSFPSKFGHFYDAAAIPHRSPVKADFPGIILSDSDFRLFMRFTKDITWSAL